MKNRNFTKGLSLFLILFMLISFFPVNLFANTDSSYLNKIEEILKTKTSSEEVEFIVTLKEEADLDDVSPEQVVDTLKDTSEKSQESLISFIEKKIKEGKISEYHSFFIINSISIKGKAELIKTLAKRPDVEHIRSNHKIVSDKEEVVRLKSNLSESDTHIPWNLESIQADRVNMTGKGIVVGIIDSGVNPNHPELQGALLSDGFKDFVDHNNTTPKDSTGHGTHVAGTILGRTIGVAKEAKFISARVFNEIGEADDHALLAAGEWILTKKPHLVNNSWGGNRDSDFYNEIVKKWRAAGIVPIFSAGNVGLFNIGGEGSIGSPASLEGSFSVGALTKEDKLAKFSLRGPSKFTKKFKPEISAPGVNILSADFRGGYIIKTGTSMAAPHVSGAVALMLQANSNLTIEKVEEILTSTATPLTDDHYISSPNMGYGHGKLNVFKAVQVALGKDIHSFGTFTGRTLISGSDNILPTIQATTPKKLYNAYDFELEAKVSDNVGIKSVKLYYKNNGAPDFTTKDFKLYQGNKKEGTYFVTIHPSDLTTSSVEYYIEAIDSSDNKFQTTTINASVESGITVGYSNDFESDADGFVFGGKTPMWEVGTPTVGPEAAHGGSNVVGTKLNGNYDGLLDSLLISPPIDLSGVTDDVMLNFWDWSELDDYQGSFQDSAEVWIGEINESETSIDKIKYDTKPVLINTFSKRDWIEHTIDLSKYKGKKIIVMFALRWNGASKRKAAGYYIDDFSIEKMSLEKPVPPSQNLSLTNRDGDGKIFIYFDKVSNKEVKNYHLYRSRMENDGFVKISKDTPPMLDTPNPQEGTYYYRIKSIKGTQESDFSQPLSLTFTKGKLVKKFNFEDGEQEWTSPSTGSWQRGKVDEDYDTPGPNSYSKSKNKNSDYVFSTSLNTTRKQNTKYELISPIIDLSNIPTATLYYQNWYKFEGRTGSDEYGTPHNEDMAEIWVKADGVDDWERIFQLDNKTFKSENINGHKRTTNAWIVDGVTIPGKFLKTNFQMKFVLDARDDSSYNQGWYIDDVSIYDTSKPDDIPTTSSDETMLMEEVTSNTLFEEKITPESEAEELPALPDLTDTKFTLLGTEFYESEEAIPATSTIPTSAIVKIIDTNTSVKSESGSGTFMMKHPAGTYKAIAYNENYKSKPFEITLKEGEKLEQDIVMSSLETFGLSFEIKDTTGASVKSDVKIFEKGNHIPKYISSSKSTVILTDIPEGEYKIVVLAAGYKTHEQIISLKENMTLPSIILTKISTDGQKKEIAGDGGDFTKAKILAPLKDNGTISVKYRLDAEHIIKKIRIGLKQATQESIVGKSFKYSIYGESTKDGLPGQILLGPITTTVQNNNNFTDIMIPDLFVKGDIYIAYTQIGEGDTVPRIAVDESVKGEGKTFKLINGAWNEASELGMYMIRLEAEKVSAGKPSSPSSPSYDTGSSYTPSTEISDENKKKESEKKDSEKKEPEKKEVEKTLNNLQEVGEKLVAQITLLEEKISVIKKLENKIKVLEKFEKKLKSLEKAEKSKKQMKTFLTKKKNRFKINLNTFKSTQNLDDIKINLKGLKKGKDYEIFFKKEKGKLKILIVGKGKFKGTFTKTIKLK